MLTDHSMPSRDFLRAAARLVFLADRAFHSVLKLSIYLNFSLPQFFTTYTSMKEKLLRQQKTSIWQHCGWVTQVTETDMGVTIFSAQAQSATVFVIKWALRLDRLIVH